MKKTNGFTFIDLLLAVLILGILASAALLFYRQQIQNARLHQAQAALLDNARFLHRHYRIHLTFKQSSTQWPVLPQMQTEHYCIKPQGNARGLRDDEFTLKAVPKNMQQDGRVLLIDQNLTMSICQSSRSVCDDALFFANPARTDENCTLFP